LQRVCDDDRLTNIQWHVAQCADNHHKDDEDPSIDAVACSTRLNFCTSSHEEIDCSCCPQSLFDFGLQPVATRDSSITMATEHTTVSPIQEYTPNHLNDDHEATELLDLVDESQEARPDLPNAASESARPESASATKLSTSLFTSAVSNVEAQADDAPPYGQRGAVQPAETMPSVSELEETHAFLHDERSLSSPEQLKERDKSSPSLLTTWWVEILSLIAATAALIAIAVTLAKYDTKEQPTWRFAINLNTLIAILSLWYSSWKRVGSPDFLSDHRLMPFSHQSVQMDVVPTSKATAASCTFR